MTDPTDLTPAEQAAAKVLLYEEGSEWAEESTRHLELAPAVVAAVRPHLAAEILTAAANSWPMPWPIEGHDWLLEQAKKFQHTADKETR